MSASRSSASRSGTLRRIVVGTDFSSGAAHALQRAILLAGEHGATLEIVHVTAPIRRSLLERLGGNVPDLERLHAGSQLQLAEMAHDATTSGVEARAHLLMGSPVPTLRKAAERWRAQLLVVGVRGERRVRDAVFGTTAERLAERAPVDILLVRQGPRARHESVLACVDLDDTATEVVAKAMSVCPGRTIRVLHAFEAPLEAKMRGAGVDHEAIALHRRVSREDSKRKLGKLLDAVGGPERSLVPVLRSGYPPTVIRKSVTRFGCDLVVLGRNRSRLGELFVGSVSKHVMREVECDVLVVSR